MNSQSQLKMRRRSKVTHLKAEHVAKETAEATEKGLFMALPDSAYLGTLFACFQETDLKAN